MPNPPKLPTPLRLDVDGRKVKVKDLYVDESDCLVAVVEHKDIPRFEPSGRPFVFAWTPPLPQTDEQVAVAIRDAVSGWFASQS